jgi:hypothetical protein
MPSERSSDVKFEIGHVLFIDIVGCGNTIMNSPRSTVGTRNVMAASFAISAQLKPNGDYRRRHDVA